MKYWALYGICIGLVGMAIACTRTPDDAKRPRAATTQTPTSKPQTSEVEPKITHEYLVSHGFTQSATFPDVYEMEHVRVGDVAQRLGFLLADLRPVVNQPSNSDERIVKIRNLTFNVRSEVRDANGDIIPESLNNPNALCTVGVSLMQIPKEAEHRKGLR